MSGVLLRGIVEISGYVIYLILSRMHEQGKKMSEKIRNNFAFPKKVPTFAFPLRRNGNFLGPSGYVH